MSLRQRRALFTVFTSLVAGWWWLVSLLSWPRSSQEFLCLAGAREAVFPQQVVPQDVGRRRDQSPREGFKGRWVCCEAGYARLWNPAVANRQGSRNTGVVPMSDTRGNLCPGRLFVPYFEALTHILTEKLHFFSLCSIYKNTHSA